VGLLSLGLTNLQAARETMQRHEGQGTLLGRRWAVLLTGVVLAIVLAGFGIASVFSFRMASTALHYLNILANWLLTGVLYVIGYPLGVLAAGLVYALRFLARFFAGGKAPQQPFTPPDFSDIQKAAEGEAVWNMPHAAVLAIKWGVVALLAAVVLFLLARALSRYWRGGRDDEVEEVSESLWSWDSFKGDILGFLAGLFGRFRVRRPVSTPEPSPPAAASANLQEERLFTVREIYAGLLWEAEQAGVPRHDAQTPYEYRASLESSLDARPPELEAITDAYVVERYGLVETPSERLPHLNRLWRQLRALLAAWQAQSRVP
jgi:hypothetical protein